MITSSSNPQIKSIIQLNKSTKARRENGLFAAEGIKMFQEAPAEWVEKVYFSESLAREEPWLTAEKKGPCEIVSDTVFRQMSDTQTPQGILTLLHIPRWREEDLYHGDGLYLVLEDLQDPGNLGTMIRTAEGAGFHGIFMTKTCVDLTNPKVIRSTMGSVFRVPCLQVQDISQATQLLHTWGVCLYAAHLEGENPYDLEDYIPGSAFMIGNEGKGLTQQGAACADRWIRIPMQGRLESLNAAMAAGILMYEAARQRRNL